MRVQWAPGPWMDIDVQGYVKWLDDQTVSSVSSPEWADAAEFGDLLFAVVNLARHLDVDPEKALTAANYKFERRFREVEALARQQRRELKDCTLEQLESLWQKAKKTVG